jgi:hypothetical protein
VSVGPSRQKKEEKEDICFKDIFFCIAFALLSFGLVAVAGQIMNYGLERVLTYTPSKAYTLDIFKGN